MMRRASLFLTVLFIAAAAHAQELLPQLHLELARQTQNDNGTTISFTRGNTLPADWILVTDENPANGRVFQAKLRSLIEGAQNTVDITFLGPPPAASETDHFTNDLRQALTNLAATGRAVTVRILFGFPVTNHWRTDLLLAHLLGKANRGHKLKVTIAAVTAHKLGKFASWPHSKMIVVDGKRAFVGGHNLYSDTYLGRTPVLDLSMVLEGRAALTAARFAGVLWKYTCTYNRHFAGWGTFSVTYDPFTRKVEKDIRACSWYISPAPETGSGGIPVLSVSHLGMGLGTVIEPDAAARWVGPGAPVRQWSDEAMTWLIGKAKSTIRISQQDIAFRRTEGGGVGWNEPVMRALAKAIQQENVDVYMILSSPGAPDYSSDVPYYNIALKIREFMAGDIPTRNRQLQARLFIAPVAIDRGDGKASTRWGNVSSVGNHAKFYMIDDKIFHIGSHNMYPPAITPVYIAGANQEFGFIIEDAASAKQFLDSYWNPRWALSKSFVMTGLDSLSKDLLAWHWRASETIPNEQAAAKICTDEAARKNCGARFKANGTWWTLVSNKHSYCECIPVD